MCRTGLVAARFARARYHLSSALQATGLDNLGSFTATVSASTASLGSCQVADLVTQPGSDVSGLVQQMHAASLSFALLGDPTIRATSSTSCSGRT